ncbi:MAG: oxidoreductase [Deltaproteobacteria bacterium HGW-Deltaproteobacteria-24]|nr:MAG: oxidoreductase [Deltaproteobacteria bacterium HGW-Deltaproteobacteria-24]
MKYDICIIGSGAGGAPVAYELSNSGFNVVVLEKGKYYKEEDFSKDELAISRREMFKPKLKDEFHIINEKSQDGTLFSYDGREYNWSFWNGSMVGGSSNLMSGFFHRLKPNDFKLKSIYGDIQGANIVDWPISYEELEPFYSKVEQVIGVSGNAKSHTFLEPRSTLNFPFKPLEENGVAQWFDKACDSLKFESIPTPRAILPQNTLGRNGCSYSNFCGSYPCATGAKGSARAALLQKCNAKIISGAFVYELKSDDKRVTHALYYDDKGYSHTIEANIFVVAAQAIETSRLLLNSKNRYFPNGLANNNNQVGKNLIFSGGGSGQGRFVFEDLNKEEKKILMQKGLFFNRSLQQWYEYEENGKKLKGGTIDFLFEHSNIISKALSEVYDKEGNVLWGKTLENKIKNSISTSRVLTFEVFNDWLPTDDCYASIDEKEKDKYGINVGVINLYGHPHDIKIGKFLSQKAVKVLEQMGARDISVSVSASPPPNLVAGGCRFGEDSNTSVLDRNCKAHELENLYVTDASFMPTGGSVPYTWTIYANAFRVAEYIINKIR